MSDAWRAEAERNARAAFTYEREMAVREMDEQGVRPTKIARTLGMTSREVHAILGIPAGGAA